MDHTKKAFFFWGKILRVVGDDSLNSETLRICGAIEVAGSQTWEPIDEEVPIVGQDLERNLSNFERKKHGYEANTQPKLVECVCGNFCSSITILRSVEGLQEKGRCSLDIPFYQHSWLCDSHPRGFLCKSTLEKGPIKCRPTV